MKIVAGLGNPGPNYQATRHNAGWMAADELARRLHATPRRCPHGALAEADDLVVFKPLAYMNRTGPPLARLLDRRQAGPEDLLVLVDDVNLSLGSLRLREGGSSGGHNGLESVIGALGTEQFHRLRMGIGPAPGGEALREFVLSPFAPEEREAAEQMAARAAQAAFCWAREGIQTAMNRFNRRADEGIV